MSWNPRSSLARFPPTAFSSVVPSDLSDHLRESLGRSKRWKFFGGHRLLYFRLSAYAKDLAQWAAAKVESFERWTILPTAFE